MRRHPFHLALALAFAISSCTCGGGVASTGGGHGSSSTGAGTSTTGTGAGTATNGGGTGATNGTSGHGAPQSLAVSPTSATLVPLNGGADFVQFTATVTFADGFSAPVAADWTFDRVELATVDGNGVVTANGQRGGDGHVSASYAGLSATAPVSVVLRYDQNPASLSPSQQALFDSPDASPSGTLLYPEDRTVFARGLLAPDLMWSGGAAGDAYRIHITEAGFEARLFINADPPSGFQLPQDLWTALTQTNQGDTVNVEVARLSGGAAHQPMRESWTIANGSLRGSIYYWAVNQGQLMKIAPGAQSPVPVFDSGDATQLGSPAPANYDGYSPPWSAGGGGKRCVACHTVSKDGSTAVAVFERKDDASSPWGTINLGSATPSVVQMSSYDTSVNFLALSPEGRYAVQGAANFTFALFDAQSGARISSFLDSIADHVADPAFSPDGTRLAFAGNVSGSYPVEYSSSGLDVLDFSEANASFANRRNLVPPGQAIAFPSFSPDSNWVLYQSGDYSRAKYGTNSVGHDDLYITDVANQVGPLALSLASGSALAPREQHISYQPTVNPISVGGYTWVVFVSPRDYGNKMASTSDPTYENRKQLWVAAVDADPQPGTDPSHPAFWLPGQDLSTVNMSGYWALDACHATGQGCSAGYECCSGFCNVSAGSELGTCGSGPTNGCSQVGEACTQDADCCGSASNVSCVGGFCSVKFR